MSATRQERYSARTSARYSARTTSAEIEVDRRPQTVDRRPETSYVTSLPLLELQETAAGAKTAPLPSITRTRLPSCTGTNSSLKLNYRPRAHAVDERSRA